MKKIIIPDEIQLTYFNIKFGNTVSIGRLLKRHCRLVCPASLPRMVTSCIFSQYERVSVDRLK